MEDLESLVLKVSGVTDDSIVDGPGMRYSIFVQGCSHNCPGCHNPQTHSRDGGKIYTLKSLALEIEENPLLYGVTFSGGEPFEQPEPLAVLGRWIKKKGLHLMCYSGYTYEQLMARAQNEAAVADLLAVTDILVDGPFIIAQRDLTLLFRGSTNQRLIDLAAMRAAGDLETVILWQENE
jgi:anaerobic ribonucleoside-triphosphate reductase activating protein